VGPLARGIDTTGIFIVGLALVGQAAPIGSALSEGMELVYESRGAAQEPWVYDSVRVVERPNFDRCIITGRRSQPARESCVRGDTLFERGEADGYRAVRWMRAVRSRAVYVSATRRLF
jgi:hypothetical protein